MRQRVGADQRGEPCHVLRARSDMGLFAAMRGLWLAKTAKPCRDLDIFEFTSLTNYSTWGRLPIPVQYPDVYIQDPMWGTAGYATCSPLTTLLYASRNGVINSMSPHCGLKQHVKSLHVDCFHYEPKYELIRVPTT